MHRASLLALVALTLASKAVPYEVEVEGYDLQNARVLRDFPPHDSEEEYFRHIHSMINAYRSDMLGGLVIETNSMVDTKYKTWKRNADLINSLLALPKGMNDAGR